MAGVTTEFIDLQAALVGRYSLERELGRGGMGIVYLAHEVSLDRSVALKLLPPAMAAEPRLRERFLREARMAARLSLPNIVPIHAVDEVDGFVFFAMAYVNGQTLGQRIRDRGPLPKAEATRILREVAWALAYAHSQGIVHRDIKPDNILLEAGSGRALVMDFGIAHMLDEPGMTGAGEVLGTAEFMSPEQASGETVDARSDIYSLGVLGYHMLSAMLPFEAETVRGLLAKHITQPAPLVRTVAPETPRQLAAIVDRCLRKDPEERFADGQSLADELGRALENRQELPVQIRVFVKRNREGLGTLGLITLGVTLIIFPTLTAGMVSGSLTAYSKLFGISALLLGSRYVLLGGTARRLLKAGYGYDDAINALKVDIERRREEITFEFGAQPSRLERITKVVAYLGLGGASLGIIGIIGLFSGGEYEYFLAIFVLGPLTALTAILGIGAGIIARHRYEQRRDGVGVRRLKFWKRKFGEWLFRLAGTGLKRLPPSASATFRPTELAIGMAADRLFEELPKEARKHLSDLPQVVRQLEGDAQRMRQRVDELNDLLAQVGRGETSMTLQSAPAAVGAQRDNTVERLQTARDLAQQRLTDAVAALETIRLNLLRMQAGVGNIDGLTQDLDAARGVAEEVEMLLAGREEVEDALTRK